MEAEHPGQHPLDVTSVAAEQRGTGISMEQRMHEGGVVLYRRVDVGHVLTTADQ